MILVTGASGFVGKPLCEALKASGYNVRQVTRNKALANGDDVVFIEDIGKDTDWSAALQGVETVVHLAARAHVMKETEVNPIDLYRAINTYGTVELGKAAVKQGVKKFIFMSTIKVNGETTVKPFTHSSLPNPLDPYGVTKFEAECMLRDLCEDSLTDLIILRPSLIYGPNVKGNLERILRFITKGFPLPFGCIHNKRTMLYIKNLIDLIVYIIQKKEKISDTFLVADQESISTKELAQYLASVLNPRLYLIPVPVFILKVLGALVGKREEIQRLTGNLEVDITYLKDKLGWTPPYSPKEGLIETANWYKDVPNN